MSESTGAHDILKVSYNHGTTIKGLLPCRSSGFVQYVLVEDTKPAVTGEQAQIIAMTTIHLSIPDSCEVEKGVHIVYNTPFTHDRLGCSSFKRSNVVREKLVVILHSGPSRKRG